MVMNYVQELNISDQNTSTISTCGIIALRFIDINTPSVNSRNIDLAGGIPSAHLSMTISTRRSNGCCFEHDELYVTMRRQSLNS
jgi:hypothetical protein